MPYKDKEKRNQASRRSMQKRAIARVLLIFRIGDESLLSALNMATNKNSRTRYIKQAIKKALRNDGYLDNDNNDNDDDSNT